MVIPFCAVTKLPIMCFSWPIGGRELRRIWHVLSISNLTNRPDLRATVLFGVAIAFFDCTPVSGAIVKSAATIPSADGGK